MHITGVLYLASSPSPSHHLPPTPLPTPLSKHPPFSTLHRVILGSSDSQRDKLLQKLVEVEMDSHAAMRQCEALKAALSKLQRVRGGRDT